MRTALRTALPLAMGMFILAVAVYRFTGPSEAAKNTPEYPVITPLPEGRGKQSPHVTDLPARSDLTRHHIVRHGGGYRHDLEWQPADGDVDRILHFLEYDRRTVRYSATRTDAGWRIEAQMRDAPVATREPVEDRWRETVTPALSREKTDTGDSDSRRELPYSDDATYGGGGYVRFESRGTMFWLWDDKVLRLEPAQ